MKLEQWPHLRTDTWLFLRKVASAITGRDVEVVPGGYPSVTRVYPKTYLSRVILPAGITGGRTGTNALLNGSFSHELLHVLMTDAMALAGVRFDVFMMCNGLEDARILTQGQRGWPGLTLPIRSLDRQVAEFRRRARAMAQSAEASKLYEVSIALYMHLTGLPDAIVRGTVPVMADEIAREVLPMAMPTLTALDTREVVAIAEAICAALAKAAEAAAQRVGTTAAYTWATAFTKELVHAHSQTMEEVLLQAGRRSYPGVWWGPWMRGGGGTNWTTVAWTWEPEKRDVYPIPARADLERMLLEADPLLERWIVRPKESVGRLSVSSTALVEAVVGCGQRRVFQRTEHEKRMVLPGLLRSIDIFVLLEAHGHYQAPEWRLMKSLAASLGRLLESVDVPVLVVRAATATRSKEVVKDAKTERSYERWSNDYYVHIAKLKGAKERWDDGCEDRLATMPAQVGFNQPLESYSRMKTWALDLPHSTRKRFYLILGKAEKLNVCGGHLKAATEALRTRREKCLYVNIGDPVEEYDDRLKEYRASFDAFLQASTVQRTIADILYSIVLEMAR